jgi:hypothetical protein
MLQAFLAASLTGVCGAMLIDRAAVIPVKSLIAEPTHMVCKVTALALGQWFSLDRDGGLDIHHRFQSSISTFFAPA